MIEPTALNILLVVLGTAAGMLTLSLSVIGLAEITGRLSGQK